MLVSTGKVLVSAKIVPLVIEITCWSRLTINDRYISLNIDPDEVNRQLIFGLPRYNLHVYQQTDYRGDCHARFGSYISEKSLRESSVRESKYRSQRDVQAAYSKNSN